MSREHASRTSSFNRPSPILSLISVISEAHPCDRIDYAWRPHVSDYLYTKMTYMGQQCDANRTFIHIKPEFRALTPCAKQKRAPPQRRGKAQAGSRRLREFLEHLIVMVKAIKCLQTLSDEDALIFAYQLLGAVNYFLISPATLSGIFGEDVMQRMSANFSIELDSLITAKIQPLADKRLSPTR